MNCIFLSYYYCTKYLSSELTWSFLNYYVYKISYCCRWISSYSGLCFLNHYNLQDLGARIVCTCNLSSKWQGSCDIWPKFLYTFCRYCTTFCCCHYEMTSTTTNDTLFDNGLHSAVNTISPSLRSIHSGL